MARPLRILHLEDDPRDNELMEAALRSDGLDCEIKLVRPLADARRIAIELTAGRRAVRGSGTNDQRLTTND